MTSVLSVNAFKSSLAFLYWKPYKNTFEKVGKQIAKIIGRPHNFSLVTEMETKIILPETKHFW